MTSAAANAPVPLSGRQTQPVYVWATIGTFFLILQAYVYSAWIMSDKFRPILPGDSPIAAWNLMLLHVLQALCVVAAIALIMWVIQNYRREGRVTTKVLFFIAFIFVFWQDPLANYFRMYFAYTSYLFNYGSWCEFIPGWIMPLGSNLPEPLLLSPLAYITLVPLIAIGICATMRKAKQKWPTIGTLGLLGIACVAGAAIDIIVEIAIVRSNIYLFPGSIHSMTLWAGEIYQFPLYEGLFGAVVYTATAALWYFRDDKGYTWVERGCESIRSNTARVFLRLMAITAFINMAFLSYTAIIWFTTFQMDAVPTSMPGHILNGMCGAGTPYECPGPDVHIPLPGSGPIPPFTGRN